jgi:chromosome segregation ATPase
MIDGIIVAMKALEITVAVNNASTKGEFIADVLVKERDALAAKVSKLEEGLVGSKVVVEEKDRRITSLEKQLADAQTALEQAIEAQNKLAEEKKALEESLRKASLPRDDDLHRSSLVDKIGELENNLVGVVQQIQSSEVYMCVVQQKFMSVCEYISNI